MDKVVVDPERYQSYLLRLWKEKPDLPWRYQVRCVSTGDEYRFSELEQVQAFLRGAATGEDSLEPGASSRSGSNSDRLDLAYA